MHGWLPKDETKIKYGRDETPIISTKNDDQSIYSSNDI